MGDASLNSSTVVEAWVVGPMFGANVVLFVLCVGILFRQGQSQDNARFRYLFTVITIQIAIAAAHASTLFANIIYSFMHLGENPISEGQDILNNMESLRVATISLYIANDIIGSAILAWRCCVVWTEAWQVHLTLTVSAIATAVSGLGAIAKYASMQSPHFEWSRHQPVGHWLLAFWTLSIVTQVSATALVSWKIWSTIAWRIRRVDSFEWAVILIIVESGALYSATTVVALVLYAINFLNACSIVLGMLGQISVMIPYLIIVRVEAQRENSERQDQDINAAGLTNVPLNEIPVVLSRKFARGSARSESQVPSRMLPRMGTSFFDLKPIESAGE